MLTAETIARWLGTMLDGNIGIVEEAPLSEVLAHTEDPVHHCVIVARTATVFEALDHFEHHARRGWSLDALVMTHGGDPNQHPLGILLRAAGLGGHR
jgi:hypothetical protein